MKKGDYDWLQLQKARVKYQAALDRLREANACDVPALQSDEADRKLETNGIIGRLSDMISRCDELLNAE